MAKVFGVFSFFELLNEFMASILAFAGSNSTTSINLKLVEHTVKLIKEHEVKVLNMANNSFPMYSEDEEKENGFSDSLTTLMSAIKEADALIVSVNEHNGNPSAYFKNLTDWLSRLDRNFLEGTKVLLMSAAPGKRGGIGALEVVEAIFPRFGAEIVATFSLPVFHTNFSETEGIIDAELSKTHKNSVEALLKTL